MSEVESYIEKMSERGRLDSVGVFTLDRGAAREKVLEFFQNRPGIWLLKLVQAAVLLEAYEARLNIGLNSLTFQIIGAPLAPTTEELMDENAREVARLVGTGLVAATAEMASVCWVLSEPHSAPSGVLYRGAEPPVNLSVDQLGALLDYQRVDMTTQVAFAHCKLPDGSWWETFQHNLAYRMNLFPALKQCMHYTPLPVRVGARDVGGGGHGERRELACEFRLGERKNDVFVAEREPGYGARVYQIPGAELPPFSNSRRLLSRWVVSGDGLFPDPGSIFEPRVMEFRGETSGTPTDQKRQLPPNSIPFWSVEMMHPRLKKYIQIPESYISRTYRHWAQSNAPGLHCHLVLSLGYPWEQDQRVEFVRNGVLLEVHSLEIGCPGLFAIVAWPELKTDATSMRIVRDDRYEELLHHLKERYWELVVKTLEVAQRQGWAKEKPCKKLARLAEQHLLGEKD